MTNIVDFDALARKTAEPDGTMGDLNNLWGAAFALSEWHFIARGTLPNFRPYIASNAEYADGKQMVRAFTDTQRLQRFARENNLTEADGSAQLLSLPTAKIIDYLEQFIQYGVHGIWFNSDTGSDGFFLPLAQLRPVKEYLAKMHWQPPAADAASHATGEPEPGIIEPVNEPAVETAAAPALDPALEPAAETATERLETLVVTVKDGLMLPSGFISKASYACNFFCRVPVGWTNAEQLRQEHLEQLYRRVYGENWRMGNDDGSSYVVIDSSTRILAPAEIAATKWSEIKNTAENHFWFYIADKTGEINSVTAEEFQAAVDAAPPLETVTAAPAFAPAAATGSETGADSAHYRHGEVSFDTTIAPFEEKIVALLKDHRGAEEFKDIFPLDTGAMEGLVENTMSNAHGVYLRVRHFFYQPDQGTLVSINTIDSNALRRAETDAALRVNFALLKNLVNQAALLYLRFEGSKTDVRNLTDAFQPILESCGFKESSGN